MSNLRVNKMKNEDILIQFMKENRIAYDKPFWVEISGEKVKYKITKKTVVNPYPEYACDLPAVYIDLFNNENWELAKEKTLKNIMFNTSYKIVKPVWKPKEGERYYFVTEDGEIIRTKWVGYTSEISYFLLGNCFPNESEAEANAEKVMALLKKGCPLVDLNEV